MDIKKAELEDLEANGKPVGPRKCQEWTRILETYAAGRKRTADRIISSENWWKLRNTQEAQKASQVGKDGGFTSQSGWLHNVIASKHADAMDAFPTATMLPRESSDKAEAQMLSDIVPCILEQNNFEETYSDAMWQKGKTGTGAFKVTWDADKLNGLGDISVTCVNLLNLYWQPEIKDIQKSRYFFQTELVDKDLLLDQYPELSKKDVQNTFLSSKFMNDEVNTSSDKATVIEVYYHKSMGGKNTLQYCKFVGQTVLYSTENEAEPEVDELGQPVDAPMSFSGLYDHGLYPFVFDALFPVEGSPCGYGYVDLCRNPQIAIDLMKTSFIKNSMVGATPRYFSRLDGNIKEEEFLDLSKPIVHVAGNLDDASIRPVEYNALPGNYINLMQDAVQELRETTGNTEASTGTAPSGVTAASALAALQEASGKGSRDSSRGSYRAFSKIVEMIVELIRQFYTAPRKFRIVGRDGMEQFVSYDNSHLVMQPQGDILGADMGARLPVFDIKIVPQKKNAYTTMAQNELALQLYQLGFFQPGMADQVLMCLDMMDFDGKDELMTKISRNAMMAQKLMQFAQMAAQGAQDPMMAQLIMADAAQTLGMDPSQMMPAPAPGAAPVSKPQEAQHKAVSPEEEAGKEPAHMEKARQHASEVTQP